MPKDLYDTAWAMLKEATINRRLPCHLVNIATIGLDGRPKVRTVVLRDANEATRTLRFHTDGRSTKIPELAANALIEAHFYDQPAKIQIRMAGIATVRATNEALAAEAWGAAKAMSKVCYRLDQGPGTTIQQSDAYDYIDFNDTDDDPGKQNFRTVTLTVETLDIVVLKANANKRAQFSFDGDSVIGRWVVP